MREGKRRGRMGQNETTLKMRPGPIRTEDQKGHLTQASACYFFFLITNPNGAGVYDIYWKASRHQVNIN